MNRPIAKPALLRKLFYYHQALRLIPLIQNWPLVVAGYFRLARFNEGKLVRLYNGLQFKVRHHLDVWGIKEVIGDNDYKLAHDTGFKTVVDIGGNIGTFTVNAAIHYPNATIYTFEPSISTFRLLEFNTRINGCSNQIKLNRLAVFSKKTKLRLYSAGPSGVRSLFKVRGENKHEFVNTITLAQIVAKFKLRQIDYLKLDCEGAEYEIFRVTPKAIFSRIKRINMEFHELEPGQNHKELIHKLQSAGFKTKASYHPIENTIGYIYAWKSKV